MTDNTIVASNYATSYPRADDDQTVPALTSEADAEEEADEEDLDDEDLDDDDDDMDDDEDDDDEDDTDEGESTDNSGINDGIAGGTPNLGRSINDSSPGVLGGSMGGGFGSGA